MKKFVKFLALCLVLVFSVSLCACASTYGKLEKAFTNEGYATNEKIESVATAIKSELEKEDLVVEIHGFVKDDEATLGMSKIYVYVFEFKSTDDLTKACEDSAALKGLLTDIASSEDAKAFYDALVEKGYANGNCLVFTTSILSANRNEVKKIVKNA